MWAVDEVLEEDALLLATSCFACGCTDFIHLLHDRLRPPETGNKVMIVTLSVQQGILHSRISDPHEVVQTYCGQHDGLCGLLSLVQGRQETSEAVSEDAEGIFDNAPFLRQTIV